MSGLYSGIPRVVSESGVCEIHKGKRNLKAQASKPSACDREAGHLLEALLGLTCSELRGILEVHPTQPHKVLLARLFIPCLQDQMSCLCGCLLMHALTMAWEQWGTQSAIQNWRFG